MLRLLSCLALLLLVFVAPARATSVGQSVFDFSGDCFDCYQGEGSVSATLTVTGYALGDEITTKNFVSFTYNGSDLLGAFTVADADVIDDGFVNGAIGSPLPGPYEFSVDGGGHLFQSYISDSEGFWCAGASCASDVGNNAVWSQGASVPEPASIAMFGLGLAAVGAFRARRGRQA
jgi:hypothetical protein